MTSTHDHDLADARTQRAALDVIRAVLLGDSEAAAVSTLTAGCTACLAVMMARMAVSLAAEVSGGGYWPVSDELQWRMLDAIAQAERDLDVAGP
jgi:hypothetical protein